MKTKNRPKQQKNEKQAEKHLKQKHERHLGKKKFKKPSGPASDDHLQKIPLRLQEIMKSQERMKLGPQKKKKKKNAPKPMVFSGDIPIPQFRKGQQESEKAYIRRMQEETEHVLFLTNCQVERKPELELKEEEINGEKKSKKKKWLSRGKVEKQKKKLNQREEDEEEELFKDEVPFGEVAMAPPSLSVKPKKAAVKPQGAPKSLLLNSLLGHSPVPANQQSMARKRIMEEERVRVVQLYRQMKKKKQSLVQEQDKASTSST
ncbi:hypothetical protein DNTS_020611 [Danionella cerebrum]|uniref:Coiled-coil domain-containing protein 137 n=1 Tax=Danionella cerebrum TaxID=2873325 RepID=A0A553R569_9TELE|nr:hypothetical protein DNTS_020611 [Danionella translucida]